MIKTADEKRRKALATALYEAPKRVGVMLQNSAVILKQSRAIRENPDASEYIVLAVDTSGGYQPFIVWTRIVGIEHRASGEYGRLDYCIAGDYHTDLGEALAAYEERAGDHA